MIIIPAQTRTIFIRTAIFDKAWRHNTEPKNKIREKYKRNLTEKEDALIFKFRLNIPKMKFGYVEEYFSGKKLCKSLCLHPFTTDENGIDTYYHCPLTNVGYGNSICLGSLPDGCTDEEKLADIVFNSYFNFGSTSSVGNYIKNENTVPAGYETEDYNIKKCEKILNLYSEWETTGKLDLIEKK